MRIDLQAGRIECNGYAARTGHGATIYKNAVAALLREPSHTREEDYFKDILAS